MSRLYKAIGLMSGTSLDGVDVALVETDGAGYVKPLRAGFYPYSDGLRDVVRGGFGVNAVDGAAQDLITQAHIDAVRAFGADGVDIIGFHGQTVFHDPANGVTVQIGDGQALADSCGVDVVYDFRSADVAAGGQGAPLLPLYHRALVQAAGLDLPVAILNIGGVSNVTFISGVGDDDILAFDCGPGNALMDDLVKARAGLPYDKDGALASKGRVHDKLVDEWLAHPYFASPAPKSLDRDAWDVSSVKGLSLEDALATLCAFTARAVACGLRFFDFKPTGWYVCGGGRHNKALMAILSDTLQADIRNIDTLGWSGDALEAEGFAYLAVRSKLGLPISLPNTTGAPKSMSGGRLVVVK